MKKEKLYLDITDSSVCTKRDFMDTDGWQDEWQEERGITHEQYFNNRIGTTLIEYNPKRSFAKSKYLLKKRIERKQLRQEKRNSFND